MGSNQAGKPHGVYVAGFVPFTAEFRSKKEAIPSAIKIIREKCHYAFPEKERRLGLFARLASYLKRKRV